MKCLEKKFDFNIKVLNKKRKQIDILNTNQKKCFKLYLILNRNSDSNIQDEIIEKCGVSI